MKKQYWKPQRISLRMLWIVCMIAVGGLLAVETYTVREKQPYYAEKIRASQLAMQAMDVIKQERIKAGIHIDPESDPAATGMIGELLTPVTTNPGHLPAKQAAANPNFAALIVHFLKRAGVEPGDTVAIGFSGSFPTLNIATLAAIKTLNLNPIIISSAGASQWGANIPGLMWTDMERILETRRVFSYRSAALSRGGIDDRALGLPRESRIMLDEAIERSGVPNLRPKNYDDSVEKRMALYRMRAGDGEIKAYVNVGGGTTSVGTTVGKKLFQPGLNRSVPRSDELVDSVMLRFAEEGVPVIHMVNANELAGRHGFPQYFTEIPPIGDGKIFYKEERSSQLAAVVLAIIFFCLVVFVRLDWGYRLLATSKRSSTTNKPEPMV